MKFENLLSDDTIAKEMGRRIAAARIERRMTQAQVAEAAGVSKRTVERLEAGASTQLTNLIRCLRALGMIEALERLLPEAPVNPVDLLRLRGRTPSRVGTRKDEAPVSVWTWGDD